MHFRIYSYYSSYRLKHERVTFQQHAIIYYKATEPEPWLEDTNGRHNWLISGSNFTTLLVLAICPNFFSQNHEKGTKFCF